MVGQPHKMKTSSRSLEPPSYDPDHTLVAYEVRGVVRYVGWLPRSVEMHDDHHGGGRYVAGAISGEHADQARWSMPPHLALANLPTYDAQGRTKMVAELHYFDEEGKRSVAAPMLRVDEKAVEKFFKEYGVLHERALVWLDYGMEEAFKESLREDGMRIQLPDEVNDIRIDGGVRVIYREAISDFEKAQSLLREAWQRSGYAIDVHMKPELAEGFELIALDEAVRSGGNLILETYDLWKFICFMFLLDYAKGRTEVCANPECVAPYFLKRRRTQKYCESGPCTAYAQRQYALKWWRTEGKKRRAKQHGKAKGRKRQ